MTVLILNFERNNQLFYFKIANNNNFSPKLQFLDGSKVVPGVYGFWKFQWILGITWIPNHLFCFRIVKNSYFSPKLQFLDSAKVVPGVFSFLVFEWILGITLDPR